MKIIEERVLDCGQIHACTNFFLDARGIDALAHAVRFLEDRLQTLRDSFEHVRCFTVLVTITFRSFEERSKAWPACTFTKPGRISNPVVTSRYWAKQESKIQVIGVD